MVEMTQQVKNLNQKPNYFKEQREILELKHKIAKRKVHYIGSK